MAAKLLKPDEMEILKAVSIKLDPETLFILTYQYHTEKDPDDPDGKKNLRSASRYRMLGRIERIYNLETKMLELRQDENRLNPWYWPDDPSWNGKIVYSNDSSNKGRSNWIRLKINKAISWENGLMLMQGFKKDTDKKSKTFGQYVVRNPNSAYDMIGYTCTNGDIINLNDKDALMNHIGQNVVKEIKMKLVGSV